MTAPPPARPSKGSGGTGRTGRTGSLIDAFDEARTRTKRSRVNGGVPRLALSKAEAAEALGVSVDFFEEHVMPELRIVRRGRRRLIPTAELMRWLDVNAHRTWAA